MDERLDEFRQEFALCDLLMREELVVYARLRLRALEKAWGTLTGTLPPYDKM